MKIGRNFKENTEEFQREFCKEFYKDIPEFQQQIARIIRDPKAKISLYTVRVHKSQFNKMLRDMERTIEIMRRLV